MKKRFLNQWRSTGKRHLSKKRRLRLLLERLEPRLLLAGAATEPTQSELLLAAETATETVGAMAYRSSADAGGTFATAVDLGVLDGSQSHPGFVGWWDRRDVIKFTVVDEMTVNLSLDELRRDVDLYLFDARGSLVGRSTHTGNVSEEITGTLDEGSYFLVVAPQDWFGSSYVIKLQGVPLAPVMPESPAGSIGTPVEEFPNVPFFGGINEWNLNAINAPEAWAQGFTGNGVTIAVVDTGVDLDHPDLLDNIFVNVAEVPGNGLDDDQNGFVDDIQGWDFVSRDNDADDRNGHGTHVAGTIAAEMNGFGATGVAPDATILPIRVLNDGGSGNSLDVASGIRYAADIGADIINLSLGGGFSSVIFSAVQYAERLGALVVVAAGNESATTPGYPALFSSVLSNVISVGASTSSNTIAGFSNRVGTSGAVQVDAPGVGIFSTFPEGRYARLSGTSMAAPQVSGLAALALSAQPNLTADNLRRLIVDGTDRDVSGSDAQGMVNAAITVAAALAVDSSRPDHSLNNALTMSNASGTIRVSNSASPVASIPAPQSRELAADSDRFQADRARVYRNLGGGESEGAAGSVVGKYRDALHSTQTITTESTRRETNRRTLSRSPVEERQAELIEEFFAAYDSFLL